MPRSPALHGRHSKWLAIIAERQRGKYLISRFLGDCPALYSLMHGLSSLLRKLREHFLSLDRCVAGVPGFFAATGRSRIGRTTRIVRTARPVGVSFVRRDSTVIF